MVPFGGWEMPLSYATGTIAEHFGLPQRHGCLRREPPGDRPSERTRGEDGVIQRTFTNDLGKVAPGRAQYTHLLDDSDGSVLDDIIVWWLDEETFDVMPNASNTVRVRTAIGGDDVTAQRAIIAVQGPKARGLPLPALTGGGRGQTRSASPDPRGTGVELRSGGNRLHRRGRSGVPVPAAAAPGLLGSLLALGHRPGRPRSPPTPCVSRRRVPLHGHELGPGITPLQAGLGWVVAWDKPGGFRGRAALVVELQSGVARHLAGLATTGRQPARQEPGVVGRRGSGELTSGNFSPVLEHGIGSPCFPDRLSPARRWRSRAGAIPCRQRSSRCRSLPRRRVRPYGSFRSPHRCGLRHHAGRPRAVQLGSSIASVPQALRLARSGHSQRAGRARRPRRDGRLAELNRGRRDLVCFAGAGAYDHDTPAVTQALAVRSRVRHRLHPVSARGGPGGPAGPVRVPDASDPPGRAGGGRTLFMTVRGHR